MRDIKESDWKLFKPLRQIALERFCGQVLDEVARIGSDDSKSRHERYLAIYRLMEERDKKIDPIFDSVRRSTMVLQLCAFRSWNLVTEQELHQFSPELRNRSKRFSISIDRSRLWRKKTRSWGGVTTEIVGQEKPRETRLPRRSPTCRAVARSA